MSGILCPQRVALPSREVLHHLALANHVGVVGEGVEGEAEKLQVVVLAMTGCSVSPLLVTYGGDFVQGDTSKW